MKKKIRRIINLNIVCYLNNLIYLFVSNSIKIEGIMQLWILSPFIFLTLTSVLMETKYHKEHLYIKKHAVIDFIIRFLGACVAFSEINLNFEVKIILTIIFFIVNMIIEFIMLNKEDMMTYNENKIKKSKYKVNKTNIAKLQLIGVYSYIGIIMLISIATGIYGYRGMSIKIVLLMILIFLIFAIVEYKKITGYYLEKNVIRKLLIRNIVPFLVGVLFYIGLKIVFDREGYDISTLFLILSMAPSIETTRDIGIGNK